MSRIPAVNSNRFYINKEIDLLSLLPNSMKETEIETFLGVFQTYLNEMYDGATKYIAPENLETIVYDDPVIWTDNLQYITSPYGTFLDFYKSGDFVKRGNETKYYKISEVIDKSTIKLIEPYIVEITGTATKTAYWDEFSTDEFSDFWNPTASASPVGMDGTIYNICYQIDTSQDRIFCISNSPSASTIATTISGDFEFEFGFHRSDISDYRNNDFGFNFSQSASNIDYRCFYSNGALNLSIVSAGTQYVSGSIVMDSEEDDWVVNVTRISGTGKLKFNVSSLKNQSNTTPLGFTSAVGFFNRFEYEMTYPETMSPLVTLRIENGLQQGWNYVYFDATSGFKGELESNSTFKKSINTISILEKIRRLTELHDPELIDIDYIQYFLNYLGYDVNINRELLGLFLQNGDPNWNSLTDEDKQKAQDDYLRFIMTSLPSWYRIKTTDNALIIMLYSFGLVTELNNYFCTNYSDKSTWITQISGSDITITDQHYQTPHFSLIIDIDNSYTNYLNNPERMTAIIDAILSVKPINTVFRGLGAYFKRTLDNIFVNAIMYSNQYVYLKYEAPSAPVGDWQDGGVGDQIYDGGIGDSVQEI